MLSINQRLEIVEKSIKEDKEIKEKLKKIEEENKEIKEKLKEIEKNGFVFEIFKEFKRVLENDVGVSLYPNIAKAINKSK